VTQTEKYPLNGVKATWVVGMMSSTLWHRRTQLSILYLYRNIHSLPSSITNSLRGWRGIVWDTLLGLWATRICAKDLKSMLTSRQPQTVAWLKSLGWPDTTAAARVYIYIGKLNRKSARKIGDVYIGSAVEYCGGLGTRRLNTLLPSPFAVRWLL
jgi:hypothetical protein